MRQLSDSLAAFSNMSFVTSARLPAAPNSDKAAKAVMKHATMECRESTFMNFPLRIWRTQCCGDSHFYPCDGAQPILPCLKRRVTFLALHADIGRRMALNGCTRRAANQSKLAVPVQRNH